MRENQNANVHRAKKEHCFSDRYKAQAKLYNNACMHRLMQRQKRRK
jgi:hypothetical protein